MPKEYYAKRILAFYKKNKRAPKSNEFSGPFGVRVRKYFGSWDAALKSVLKTNGQHIARGDDELLKPIKKYYEETKKLIPLHALPNARSVRRRFGFAEAVELAIGINIYKEILRAIYSLTRNGADVASAGEIVNEVNAGKIIVSGEQVRGFIQRALKRGEIEMLRGDQLSLYRLSRAGKIYLFDKENLK